MSHVLYFGAISTSTESGSNNSNTSFSSEEESSSQAGSSSLENTGDSEMLGIAVFKGDTLVGELTAKETLCHLIIINGYESTVLTIPNPADQNTSIDLFLYNKSNPKIKVDIINGNPFIDINVKLEAKVLSVNENANYISEEELSNVEQSANQYIEKILLDYLYKTSTEFGSDIDGFGRYVLKHFKTMPDYMDYNWLDNYKNSFFKVTVDTNVQSAFLLSGK